MKHALMLLKSRDGGSARHHNILHKTCYTHTRIDVDITFIRHLNIAKFSNAKTPRLRNTLLYPTLWRHCQESRHTQLNVRRNASTATPHPSVPQKHQKI